MGCDIHVVLEEFESEAKLWEVADDFRTIYLAAYSRLDDPVTERTYLSPNVRTRDYAFFGALAGVRCEGPPPKGTPDDIAAQTKQMIDGWGDDGHSHSWDTTIEFVDKWLSVNKGVAAAYLAAQRLEGKTFPTHGSQPEVFTPMRQAASTFLFGSPYFLDPAYRVIYWFDN